MRKIEVSIDDYGRLMKKYMKEDLSDLFGVDVTDAPVDDTDFQKVLNDATDPVLADDIIDGAARWYAYKQTFKIRQVLKVRHEN